MEKIIADIFAKTTDNEEIVATIRTILQPILNEREGDDNYLNKLSFCTGYQIKKAEILKTIIYNSLAHNTIGIGLDKKLITEKVDGIISSEADVNILNKTTDYYHSEVVFKSNNGKNATYIMTCMRFIIQSCLMLSFIEYLSKTQSSAIFSAPPDDTFAIITRVIEKYTRDLLATV